MPAAAIPAAITAGGAIASGVSGKKAAEAQADAAQAALNAPVKIPGDILGLRTNLSRFFNTGLAEGGLNINTPQTNAILSRIGQVISPDFLQGFLDQADPLASLNLIGEARRPVFEANLQDTLGGLQSQLGAQFGVRAGLNTDVAQVLGREAGRAESRFEQGITDLFPQLQANQIAFGSLAPAIGNLALGAGGLDLQRGLAPLQTLLGAAVPFATAGVGGTNAGAFASFGGPSPQASFLGPIAETAANFPLMQQLFGNFQQQQPLGFQGDPNQLPPLSFGPGLYGLPPSPANQSSV